jgi:hypothetical protein
MDAPCRMQALKTFDHFQWRRSGRIQDPIYPNTLVVSQGRHQDGSHGKGHISMEAAEDVHLRDTHQNKLSTSWKLLQSDYKWIRSLHHHAAQYGLF